MLLLIEKASSDLYSFRIPTEISCTTAIAPEASTGVWSMLPDPRPRASATTGSARSILLLSCWIEPGNRDPRQVPSPGSLSRFLVGGDGNTGHRMSQHSTGGATIPHHRPSAAETEVVSWSWSCVRRTCKSHTTTTTTMQYVALTIVLSILFCLILCRMLLLPTLGALFSPKCAGSVAEQN